MSKLLLESGSVLLLEDGSALLLEEASAARLLLESGSAWLLEDGSALLLEYDTGSGGGPVTPSMYASPTRLKKNRVTLVSFVGAGTNWLSSPPSLSGSGVPGVSAGAATVQSSGSFVVTVTTGPNTGSVTWTDATSGASCAQPVEGGGSALPFVSRPRPRGRRRG